MLIVFTPIFVLTVVGAIGVCHSRTRRLQNFSSPYISTQLHVCSGLQALLPSRCRLRNKRHMWPYTPSHVPCSLGCRVSYAHFVCVLPTSCNLFQKGLSAFVIIHLSRLSWRVTSARTRTSQSLVPFVGTPVSRDKHELSTRAVLGRRPT